MRPICRMRPRRWWIISQMVSKWQPIVHPKHQKNKRILRMLLYGASKAVVATWPIRQAERSERGKMEATEWMDTIFYESKKAKILLTHRMTLSLCIFRTWMGKSNQTVVLITPQGCLKMQIISKMAQITKWHVEALLTRIMILFKTKEPGVNRYRVREAIRWGKLILNDGLGALWDSDEILYLYILKLCEFITSFCGIDYNLLQRW